MLTRQMVVLCGGRGTRLAGHGNTRQKCLTDVSGRPMLDYVLDAAREWKMTDVVLIAGYASHEVERFAERLSQAEHCFQLHFRVSSGGPVGAIREYLPLLEERFLLCVGDVLPPSQPDVWERLNSVMDTQGADAVMASASAGEGPDSGNLLSDGAMVQRYAKGEGLPLIDRGTRLLRKSALESSRASTDGKFFSPMAIASKLAHCPLPGRIIDIDTPERLQSARWAFERGEVHV